MSLNWLEENNMLQKTYVFEDFKQAMTWMTNAAVLIDKADHHPVWTNNYNKVIVRFSTHDAGNNVTEKDRQMANLLDTLPIN